MKTKPEEKISRDQLVERLRSDIVNGNFSEGEPLREQHLAERYNVKRGPVRDALLILSVQGLLEFIPNRGATIRRPPNEAIRPLITEMRCNIEEYVVTTFFKELQERVPLLEKILEGMNEACQEGRERELARFDLLFHLTMIESSADKEVIALWQSVVYRMILHYSRLARIQDSYMEHVNIVEKIKTGAMKEVIQLLRHNIT